MAKRRAKKHSSAKACKASGGRFVKFKTRSFCASKKRKGGKKSGRKGNKEGLRKGCRKMKASGKLQQKKMKGLKAACAALGVR